LCGVFTTLEEENDVYLKHVVLLTATRELLPIVWNLPSRDTF
jgi:hypothetical protein